MSTSTLNTPPFGPYEPTRLLGYTGQDFPAPAGVPPLAGAPVATAVAPAPRRRTGTLIVAAALSAVIGAGAGVGSFAVLTDQTTSAVSPISVTNIPAADSPKLDGTVSAAAAQIEPSVVTISVRSGQSGGVGTGVVLDDKGHILTNNHVVASATQGGEITVAFDDGSSAPATVVGTSPSNDLAVIKVAPSAALKPATFAKSDTVQVGQAVVAVGAPLGLSESVTSGIVSNGARPVRSGDEGDAVYLAVQTDAAINPGNSGGPLVDLNGAVVGINSSIASTGDGSGGQSGNIGIGFAIPADVAVRVAGELVQDGTSTNAALGVSTSAGDSAEVTTSGVVLESVEPGSAAEKAGLQAGDRVTRLNEFSTTTADGLIAAVRYYAPGTKVTVEYNRDGDARTAEVTLGSS